MFWPYCIEGQQGLVARHLSPTHHSRHNWMWRSEDFFRNIGLSISSLRNGSSRKKNRASTKLREATIGSFRGCKPARILARPTPYGVLGRQIELKRIQLGPHAYVPNDQCSSKFHPHEHWTARTDWVWAEPQPIRTQVIGDIHPFNQEIRLFPHILRHCKICSSIRRVQSSLLHQLMWLNL